MATGGNLSAPGLRQASRFVNQAKQTVSKFTTSSFSSTSKCDRLYMPEHYWIEIKSEAKGLARLGCTEYGQEKFGDINYIGLEAALKEEVHTGDNFITIDAENSGVKDLKMPITASIRAMNLDIEKEPVLLNRDPEHTGWIAELEVADLEEVKKGLMDRAAYREYVEQEISDQR